MASSTEQHVWIIRSFRPAPGRRTSGFRASCVSCHLSRVSYGIPGQGDKQSVSLYIKGAGMVVGAHDFSCPLSHSGGCIRDEATVPEVPPLRSAPSEHGCYGGRVNSPPRPAPSTLNPQPLPLFTSPYIGGQILSLEHPPHSQWVATALEELAQFQIPHPSSALLSPASIPPPAAARK
jgi:hypothetical protein